MSNSVIAITPGGRQLALKIGGACGFTVWLPKALCEPEDDAHFFAGLRELVCRRFQIDEALVLIMASGIAVRILAPLLRDKQSDPAVVVMDEDGRFAISLLSGHWGGANALAERLAQTVGALPVITTATDGKGLYAVDLFAREIDARPEPFSLIKTFNAAMLRAEKVTVFTDLPAAQLPCGNGLLFLPFSRFAASEQLSYRALLTNRHKIPGAGEGDLFLRPPNLYLGVGCRRGIGAIQILTAIASVLERFNLAAASVAALASIDRKRDEEGLRLAAQELGLPVKFYKAEQIKGLVASYEQSAFVQETMGVGAVCEPTAILAAKGGRLLVPKQKINGVTVAVAEAEYPWSASAPAGKRR
ncbi:MAG: cobalt-precorrin 5A hydrolase [Dethiobacter sp.]|nr:cobalt-precorrin 5A hydrolase [Dethiobacter sp.]